MPLWGSLPLWNIKTSKGILSSKDCLGDEEILIPSHAIVTVNEYYPDLYTCEYNGVEFTIEVNDLDNYSELIK
jgi:hypothetical protein